MNQKLFSFGLLIIGFTLIALMPASMKKNWKTLGNKPVGGDAVVMLMRFLGFLVIISGLIFMAGVVDIGSVVNE